MATADRGYQQQRPHHPPQWGEDDDDDDGGVEALHCAQLAAQGVAAEAVGRRARAQRRRVWGSQAEDYVTCVVCNNPSWRCINLWCNHPLCPGCIYMMSHQQRFVSAHGGACPPLTCPKCSMPVLTTCTFRVGPRTAERSLVLEQMMRQPHHPLHTEPQWNVHWATLTPTYGLRFHAAQPAPTGLGWKRRPDNGAWAGFLEHPPPVHRQ